MTINQLAGYIASIRKDLAVDSAQNVEALMLNLLKELQPMKPMQDVPETNFGKMPDVIWAMRPEK